ncbi:sugar-binding protein [Prevotella melaninogenica]|uniref:Sugar-binding protein n=2 Tax=Prevotella melaninogenica TaxID=28132 RepID=A0A250KGZ9_9BACT|nr:sugar-binding protein [Prevotella melaninogenica]
MRAISGHESFIVDKIGYDKEGYTVYTKLGNGTETTYAYDKQRERLQVMNLTADGQTVMENRYSYDAVDNILGITNAANPTSLTKLNKAKLGGRSSHTYEYDELNRLIHASGKAKRASYDMVMSFGRMSEPLTKVQKVDSTTTAKSYNFAYKYEDSNHPTAPTQIGHDHYTYDANGNPTLVTNDSTNTTREMYWDEDNRLMVLSDNGKTSRYTYNAAGERIMKSYGTMEGVYINGAPQGITFHETDNFTLYPASILSVNKNRFTKHYFIGDKRVASRIGTGLFNNVYGRNGSYVTAGQQDYAERMNQIQRQKEAYYKQQGIAPGVPTMKGAYGDPENTKRGYNSIIDTLGNHDVPQGWIQTPRPNTTPNTNPGPPVSWNDPSNPDDPQAGYGYIPNDTTKEETFFYHSDHLGSTSYITDDKGNITQYDAYLPYGELLIDEHSSSEDLPYKFNGKEFDEETGLYYYGARYMNPVTSLWYGVDPQIEKMPKDGSYSYCFGNPIKLIDPNGERPTEEEAARISAHVYGTEKVTLTGGWHLSKYNKTISGITLRDKDSGFKSAIYERTYKGKTEYVYATAGTDFTEMNDWKNNIKQIIGKSEQYDISMRNAEKISQVIGNSELTFTGHSLGGGLAAANAYKTGRSAMTFNAAWVSPFTIFNRKFPRIDAYINWQDELHKVQRSVGLRADGFPHYRFNRRAILGHSIQNFYRTDIELMKDEIKAKNELYQRMYIDSFHGFPQ